MTKALFTYACTDHGVEFCGPRKELEKFQVSEEVQNSLKTFWKHCLTKSYKEYCEDSEEQSKFDVVNIEATENGLIISYKGDTDELSEYIVTTSEDWSLQPDGGSDCLINSDGSVDHTFNASKNSVVIGLSCDYEILSETN